MRHPALLLQRLAPSLNHLQRLDRQLVRVLEQTLHHPLIPAHLQKRFLQVHQNQAHLRVQRAGTRMIPPALIRCLFYENCILSFRNTNIKGNHRTSGGYVLEVIQYATAQDCQGLAIFTLRCAYQQMTQFARKNHAANCSTVIPTATTYMVVLQLHHPRLLLVRILSRIH